MARPKRGRQWPHGQKGAKRDGQFHIAVTDDHLRQPHCRAQGRCRKNCKKNTLPADKRTDHCQQFDIPAAHAFRFVINV